MTLDELRRCDACDGPIGVTFHSATCEQHVVSPIAVQQRAGMEMFFGGNAAIAAVFDAHGSKSTTVLSKVQVILCENCWAQGLVPDACERRATAMERVENE